jgi:hypothetical protein
MPATRTTRKIVFRTARHSEFLASQALFAEGSEHTFHLAAQIGQDTHAGTLQITAERLRNGATDHHIDVQLGQASGKDMRRKRSQQNLTALNLLPPAAHDYQQPSCGVEHRRHPFLPNRDGNRHIRPKGKSRASPRR